MAELPLWNYWMYETLSGETDRKISIYEGKDLAKKDVRNKDYDLDHRAWCRKYFWNAEQAALISFVRDPDKVVSRDSWEQGDGYDDEDFERHNELWDQIEKLFELIKDSQKTAVLPEFFSPTMYIEWAKHIGFYFPDYVKRELENVERVRSKKAIEIIPGKYVDSNEVPESNLKQVPEKKSAQTKIANNDKTILLALLIESNLIKRGATELSMRLAKILRNKAFDEGDDALRLGDEAIAKRLQEARDLIE
jgi:hypothetical protein